MAKLTEEEQYQQYDEMLDEGYGEVEIAGFTFDTSDALKKLDPIAYQCGFNDFADGQLTDGIDGWVDDEDEGDDYEIEKE